MGCWALQSGEASEVLTASIMTSGNFVNFYPTTRHYSPKDNKLRARRRENDKYQHVNLASVLKVASSLSTDWYHRRRRWQQMGPRPRAPLGNRPLDHEFSTGQVTTTDSSRQQHAWEDLSPKNRKEYLAQEYAELSNAFFVILHKQFSGNTPQRFNTLTILDTIFQYLQFYKSGKIQQLDLGKERREIETTGMEIIN